MLTTMSRYEQETLVNYNNEEKTATVYTADPVVQRKLDKLVEKYPNDYKCTRVEHIGEGHDGKFYWLSSKKFISFRPPVYMTDEQKKAAAERLALYKKHKKD